MNFQEFFGEPIFVYTDEDALNDGELVDVSSLRVRFQNRLINRLTKHVWEEFKPFLTKPDEKEETEEIDMDELKSILKTKLQYAYYKGDIWQLPPGLWLIENEVNGWTFDVSRGLLTQARDTEKAPSNGGFSFVSFSPLDSVVRSRV